MLEFVFLSFILELTPGPNMGFLAALTMAQGRRAGLVAIAGVAAGLSLYGAAASFGLMLIIMASPIAFQMLKWLGVVYMLYLAWDTWCGEKPDTSEPSWTKRDARLFLKGLITNMLNPKAGLFFMTIMPQFIPAGTTQVLSFSLMLVALYVGVATLVHVSIVLMAERAYRFLHQKGWDAPVRALMAMMLVLMALWITQSM
jgi:threonine/homoserine/homoserine lactone efflux protein